MPDAVQDVIKHANFGEDWRRGFGVEMGRNLVFSIYFAIKTLSHCRASVWQGCGQTGQPAVTAITVLIVEKAIHGESFQRLQYFKTTFAQII